MNDATLYGYQIKGKSHRLPVRHDLQLHQQPPGVVSVDAAGKIHTVADGVATVTANATYGGVTKSTSFVVDVVSQLSGITVNGQPLSEFNPGRAFASDTYGYDVVLPAGSAMPTVAATSADPSAGVVVTQAAGVPGSATIVSTGADGTPYTYTVNFAYPLQSDEFNGSAPGPQWTLDAQRPDSRERVRRRAEHHGADGRPQRRDQHGEEPAGPARAGRLGGGDQDDAQRGAARRRTSSRA